LGKKQTGKVGKMTSGRSVAGGGAKARRGITDSGEKSKNLSLQYDRKKPLGSFCQVAEASVPLERH